MLEHENTRIESLRLSIQAKIDSQKSAAERNRLGQFATPNALAVDIARYVESLLAPDESPIRFGDPAVGSGSFFSAMMEVFGAHRIHAAMGIEIDPAFAGAARTLWGAAGLRVVQGDFARVIAGGECPLAPNVLLANPPYVRHHHISREDKERLRSLAFQLTSVRVNGLAGLYVYFLLLATAWMENNGVAAWLIPSEFMDVNYGAALKGYLTDQVTLIRVHRFDPSEVQFGDALVSSVVLVFRKSAPPAKHSVQFTFGGTLTGPLAGEMVTLDQLRTSRKWTTHPTHARNDRYTISDGNGPVLGDFFRIQRGIATGCNKFFVLERAEAARLGLPGQFLRPILPSPRHLKAVIIDSHEDGYPKLDQSLCLIDCGLPEPMVAAQFPALWNYLQSAHTLGFMGGYLIGKRSPWYRQEQRKAAPFLCTYMGRGAEEKQPFRFILNRSHAIATNLYLMLYPRDGLAAMLRQYPDCAGKVHGLLAQVTGRELRGEGRTYGGGLNKIEPGELARVSAVPFAQTWPELAVEGPPQRELFG